IFGHDVPGIGRLRATITRERGAYAIGVRLLGPRLPTLENLGVTPDQISKLKNLTPGLWIIGGRSGSGRSTTLAALVHQLAHEGRHVATLEDPIGFSFSRTTGIRQLEFETDLNRADCKRIVRSLAVDTVLFDLVDDALAIDLALDSAAQGRLAICVVRSLSTAALLHRAVSMDAALHQHRIAEHLSGIVFQQLAINETKTAYQLQAEIFIPDEALRRNLRSP
ncbi:MAG: ATPase, T2SS/T4P/T4SS family, partial [candidate division KSB1 bacterium]